MTKAVNPIARVLGGLVTGGATYGVGAWKFTDIHAVPPHTALICIAITVGAFTVVYGVELVVALFNSL